MNPKAPDYSAVYNGPNLEYCSPCQQAANNAAVTAMPMMYDNSLGYPTNQPTSQKEMKSNKMSKNSMQQGGAMAPTSAMGSSAMPMPMPMAGSSAGSMLQGTPSPASMAQGTMPQTSIAQGTVAPGPMVQGSVAQGLMAQGLISQGAVSQGSVSQGALAPSSQPSAMAPITDTTQVMPLTAESLEYLNGFLRSQVGRRVRVQFLIGTNTFMDKSGLLLGVGANYILLREAGTDDLLACDFYNIKFVTFLY